MGRALDHVPEFSLRRLDRGRELAGPTGSKLSSRKLVLLWRQFRIHLDPFLLGVSHRADLHFGQMRTSACRGIHSCPHRRHRSVGNLSLILVSLPIGSFVGQAGPGRRSIPAHGQGRRLTIIYGRAFAKRTMASRVALFFSLAIRSRTSNSSGTRAFARVSRRASTARFRSSRAPASSAAGRERHVAPAAP